MNEDLSEPKAPSGTNPAGSPPPEPKSLVSTSEDEEPTREARKHNRYRKFKNFPVWIEAACAVALVIITWCYTHYASQQAGAAIKAANAAKDAADIAACALQSSNASFDETLGQMKAQSKAMHDQVGRLDESNRINRESLTSVQRAFITCHNIFQWKEGILQAVGTGSIHHMWNFTIPCENAGTTTANITAIAFNGHKLPSEPTEDIFAHKPPLRHDVMGPKATTMFGEVQSDEENLFGKELPENLADLLNPEIGKQYQPLPTGYTYYFWGWIAYHDVFRNTRLHITEFCERMAMVDVNRETLKDMTFHYQTCINHNCADENCEDYKAIEKISE